MYFPDHCFFLLFFTPLFSVLFFLQFPCILNDNPSVFFITIAVATIVMLLRRLSRITVCANVETISSPPTKLMLNEFRELCSSTFHHFNILVSKHRGNDVSHLEVASNSVKSRILATFSLKLHIK